MGDVQMTTPTKNTKTTANANATENTATATPVSAKSNDIQKLINALPETFTPALFDRLFQINDGGKTIRRHLRKQFANDLKHAHNDKWQFNKADSHSIIEYFCKRYVYDLNALKPANK